MNEKVVRKKRSGSLSLTVVVLAVLTASVHVCSAADKADADEALGLAEEGLRSAFISVREAEQAGAEVEDLLIDLEVSGGALAQAYSAYRKNDFESAYAFAIDSSADLTGVADEANSLRMDAQRASSERLLLTAGISSICLCVLLVTSLFGWRHVRRRFIKQVLESRPRLVEYR